MVMPPSLLARSGGGGGGGGGLLSPVMPGRSSNFAFNGAANYALLESPSSASLVGGGASSNFVGAGLRSSNRLVDLQPQQIQVQQQQQQPQFQHEQPPPPPPDAHLLQQQQQQQAQHVHPDMKMDHSQPIKMEQQPGNIKMESENSNTNSNTQPNLLIPKVEVKMEVKTEDDLHLQQHPQMLQQQQQQQQIQRQELIRLQQQQQQQAHLSLLHQQRMLKHQQQQLMQSMPQQHAQRIQQQQQQQQPPSMVSLPPKQPSSSSVVYEPGSCYRRVMQYIYQQKLRPTDNNIVFWRKFVSDYFAPRAKKRWCVSLYGSGNDGRQPTGVFPQDVWQCEICGTKPGRGFETTVEVLPRLCKIKYDSGINEELLFVDSPHEYRLNSGLIVLQCGKAIQESIFDQLRVVRDGQLRIIFSPELKILSWEFCARSHEELLYRRTIVPQVNQLANVAQKYHQSTVQAGTTGLSQQDLLNNCNMFVSTSRNLARNLEVPTVNDLGYTKRYVRCLQISEVVNSMKDLIDFSHENDKGPIQSLIAFPRRGGQQPAPPPQPQPQDHQLGVAQTMVQDHEQQHQQQQGTLNLPSITIPPKHHLLSNGLHGSLSSPNLLGSFPSLVQQNSGFSSLQGSALPSPSSSSIIPKSLNVLQQQQHLQLHHQQHHQQQQGPFHNPTPSPHMNSLQSPTHSNNNSTILNPPSLTSNHSNQQQGSIQQQQPDAQSVVHHLLQGMMMNSGGNGGGIGGSSSGLGMPSVGNSNPNPNNGIVLQGNSSVYGGVGNSMNNGRLSMGSSHQQQQQPMQLQHQQQQQQQQQQNSMYLQDASVHSMAGNGILSSLNGFEIPFDWKSP